MHTSVLLHEAIDALHVTKGGRYIDATFGVGGHSSLIVEKGGSVLALDWDAAVVSHYNDEAVHKGILLVHANYADIRHVARDHNWVPCDGVLFDLGLSMAQIRGSGRGFSYQSEGEPLDMRLDKSLETTAADIINISSQEYLHEIFAKNAEELSTGAIVQNIVRARTLKQIRTVDDMKEAMDPYINQKTLARVFQALRMEVNHEYENIQKALEGTYEILRPGGRLAIITFHPGEDRLVKRKTQQLGFKHLSKKPIVGDYRKKFERSAKLRILERPSRN